MTNDGVASNADRVVADVPLDARVVRTRNDILGTALQVLADSGLEAVTHAHLAEVAGYSKATLYKHWPNRVALFRDAFERLREMPHSTPTGDLRSDLVAELTEFRTVMRDYQLDRGLTALASLAAAEPEMIEVRDNLVADGERVFRAILARHLLGPRHEAALTMCSGSILYPALMHGRLPDDAQIAAVVDLIVNGILGCPHHGSAVT